MDRVKDFRKTKGLITEERLCALFSMDEGEKIEGDVVGTCSGEWRREGQFWRFYEDPGMTAEE